MIITRDDKFAKSLHKITKRKVTKLEEFYTRGTSIERLVDWWGKCTCMGCIVEDGYMIFAVPDGLRSEWVAKIAV